MWDWKRQYGGRIVQQQKKLGASCDWDRARFTMDEGCSKAVRETFCELYEKGLIYKGSRIINWCPHCVTALSDAEVEYQDKPGSFWHIRYPIAGEEGRYVIVATTRPETMLGDTGVAVHPDDERYKDIVGKKCILPLVGREMPIVADDYVDMEFGTGCVKMTPAHDPNDFEVGLRHNLETIRVLDDNGKVVEGYGKYSGMDRYEARKAIVADLEEQGYLVKVEPHQHNVGTCYRCHNDVEPIISAQWFVKMKPLAEAAIKVVEDGEVKFVPDRFAKTYLNWMENVHDWCISRQLWWGHQIPVWYCADCGHMTVSRTDPTECEACHSKNIERDPDVLDTWFSSALWPFSTLGWPEKTEDLDYFYPTDVLVTGYDIIFFWVARMIFSACEQTKKPPFHTVFIHGLVRDDKGRKMSKSLGNGIDPLEIAEKYGADALRFNLITGNSPGNDMRFYTERCEAMRNFANKIWNASRFLMMNLTIDKCELPEKLELEDKWILSKLNRAIREITENMDRYELGVAAQKIYDFIWDDYCDWYIELTKTRLQGEDEDSKVRAQQVLCHVLTQMLKLLHPFMPFITEEIWQALPHEDEVAEGSFLMLQSWPVAREALDFPEEEKAMELIMDLIRAVRTRRSEMNVPPQQEGPSHRSHRRGGHLPPGRGLPEEAGLRQRGGLRPRGHRPRGGLRHRGHPRRPGLYAHGGAGGPGEGEGPHGEGAEEELRRAPEAGDQAPEPRLCEQGPRARGQGRAGAGRPAAGPGGQAGGAAPGDVTKRGIPAEALVSLWNLRSRSGGARPTASVCRKTCAESNPPETGRGSSRGQPPAPNGIKCPGSLAVQGFRQAKRRLLRRCGAQK